MKSYRKILWFNTKSILILFLIFVFSSQAYAGKRLHKEREYQDAWCTEHKGETEYVLEDKTRVDCLTDTHAVEVDFADHWYCAVGQSLHYARMSGKKPGIVLIIEDQKDEKYLERLRAIAEDVEIKVWVVSP